MTVENFNIEFFLANLDLRPLVGIRTDCLHVERETQTSKLMNGTKMMSKNLTQKVFPQKLVSYSYVRGTYV